ncbi:hypothetical protein L9F63_023598, partial [Diploptera punctata]
FNRTLSSVPYGLLRMQTISLLNFFDNFLTFDFFRESFKSHLVTGVISVLSMDSVRCRLSVPKCVVSVPCRQRSRCRLCGRPTRMPFTGVHKSVLILGALRGYWYGHFRLALSGESCRLCQCRNQDPSVFFPSSCSQGCA